MNHPNPEWKRALDVDGYAIIPDVINRAEVQRLIGCVSELSDANGIRARNAGTYAIRNLLSISPEVRELASSKLLGGMVQRVLGAGARVVRGLFFDKTAGANWKVPWHQDVSIAVRQHVEVTGFGPWSRKAGVVHVQPPASVLENMLTIRLHLDDCGMENGPLQVLPGSHVGGFISSEGVSTWRQNATSVSCMVQAGGVVLIRPLLLHASSVATLPGHRRVIHLEYASGTALPAGVEWHERIDDQELQCNPR